MGRRQGGGYCLAGLYCLTNEVIKIIIKNEILIQIKQTRCRTGSETARKSNEDGERDQMNKERRCGTKRRGGDLFTLASAQHCKLQAVVGRFRQGCVVLNYLSELGCPSKPPGLT